METGASANIVAVIYFVHTARALLLRILDAFTRKCSVLKSVFPKLRRQRGVADGTDPATVQMSAKPQQPPSVLSEDIVDVELLLPIHTTVLAEITPLETVKGGLAVTTRRRRNN